MSDFSVNEIILLRKLHQAAEQVGQARKHDCPGFDCATCNTTALYEALNNLQVFYIASEKADSREMNK